MIILRYFMILYIYNVYRSWSSGYWAAYPRAILVIIYTLAYFSSNTIVLVIGIYDKYKSLILIGLALTENAQSGIQYILFHYRSYWRGWQPLVTPWAGCIKEGIEPWKSQKWFFPSHVQVSVSLCSLLLLLLCFCFGCSSSSYYYYCYYEYLLAKGFYYNNGYESKPGPYYSNDYENKPGHFNKQNSSLVLCSLSLSLSLSHSLSLSLSLSLSADDHHVGSWKSNLYDITSFSLSLSLSLLLTIM